MASHWWLHAPAHTSHTFRLIRLKSARSPIIAQVSVTAIEADAVASQEITLQVPNGGSDVTAQIKAELDGQLGFAHEDFCANPLS